MNQADCYSRQCTNQFIYTLHLYIVGFLSHLQRFPHFVCCYEVCIYLLKDMLTSKSDERSTTLNSHVLQFIIKKFKTDHAFIYLK